MSFYLPIYEKEKMMANYDGNYMWLPIDPPTPKKPYPTKNECEKFEFIKMSQLCEITQRHGLGRSPACEAFGGDRGRNKVSPERQARAVEHKKSVRKYVLTTAAIEYLRQVGIGSW
jgi:hypothetical protein